MIAARPTAAFAFSHPAYVLAFGFGAGLAPRAPGTVGTLAAWPIGWLIGGLVPPAPFAAAMVMAFLVGIWACDLTGRALGVADHRAMVWDEMVAFLFVLAVTGTIIGFERITTRWIYSATGSHPYPGNVTVKPVSGASLISPSILPTWDEKKSLATMPRNKKSSGTMTSSVTR